MPTGRDVKPPTVALDYAEEIRTRLGDHVRQVVLFGSHARGDATEASDYDFVIVVDKKHRELREAVLDAGIDQLNKHDALCAALIYDTDQWEKVRCSPLGWNVEREGLVL